MTSLWTVPLSGGLLAMVAAVGSRFLIGSVYSKIATSSATIPALMLTLLVGEFSELPESWLPRDR